VLCLPSFEKSLNANTTNSILSRAHSNYLAQLNIAMNERAEQTGDVLGKLTVLGSMVLPLNIVTGMWGYVFLPPPVITILCRRPC
jgi:magnesium transporter